MTTQDVLNAIDHALDDWSVSDDAMRWQPERSIPYTHNPNSTLRFIQPLPRIEIRFDPAPLQAAFAKLTEVINAFKANPAFQKALETLQAAEQARQQAELRHHIHSAYRQRQLARRRRVR